MNSVDKIKCQNCGTEIDVNLALSYEIEARLKNEYSSQNSKNLEEIEKLKKEKTEISEAVTKEKEKEYSARLEKEKDKIREELNKENEEGIKSLQKAIREKSEQTIEFNKTKIELEKIRQEKEEIEYRITAEKDAELNVKLKNEREAQKKFLENESDRIKKEAAEENALKIEELKKKLADQTALAQEMKQKAEQGSMQLQGEVQELAIEDILRDTFRFDVIDPVPKGISGADVIQRVRNKHIVDDYIGGMTYGSLARKYTLSVMRIRQILGHAVLSRHSPLQMSFFDN